jgi:hypothetical protein
MKNYNSISLFLVDSPLQLLNAIEAANHFKSDKNILLLRLSGDEESDTQIKKLIKIFNWTEVHLIDFSNIKNRFKRILIYRSIFLKFKKKFKHKEFPFLFFGDFRSEWMHHISQIISSKTIYLLDDGSITLDIQNKYFSKKIFFLESSFKRMRNFTLKNFFRLIVRKSIEYVLYFGVFKSKPKNQVINLFTSFNIKSVVNQNIVKNNYFFLKSRMQKKKLDRKAVYYFGSKHSEKGNLSLDREIKHLKKVLSFFNKLDLKMTYVPHRVDSSVKIKRINKELGIKIKKLGIPAELFFTQSRTIPSKIAGAHTTAINNLNLTFDFDKIFVFCIPLDEIPKSNLQEILKVYCDFSENGIDVIDFYSQENFFKKI